MEFTSLGAPDDAPGAKAQAGRPPHAISPPAAAGSRQNADSPGPPPQASAAYTQQRASVPGSTTASLPRRLVGGLTSVYLRRSSSLLAIVFGVILAMFCGVAVLLLLGGHRDGLREGALDTSRVWLEAQVPVERERALRPLRFLAEQLREADPDQPDLGGYAASLDRLMATHASLHLPRLFSLTTVAWVPAVLDAERVAYEAAASAQDPTFEGIIERDNGKYVPRRFQQVYYPAMHAVHVRGMPWKRGYDMSDMLPSTTFIDARILRDTQLVPGENNSVAVVQPVVTGGEVHCFIVAELALEKEALSTRCAEVEEVVAVGTDPGATGPAVGGGSALRVTVDISGVVVHIIARPLPHTPTDNRIAAVPPVVVTMVYVVFWMVAWSVFRFTELANAYDEYLSDVVLMVIYSMLNDAPVDWTQLRTAMVKTVPDERADELVDSLQRMHAAVARYKPYIPDFVPELELSLPRGLTKHRVDRDRTPSASEYTQQVSEASRCSSGPLNRMQSSLSSFYSRSASSFTNMRIAIGEPSADLSSTVGTRLLRVFDACIMHLTISMLDVTSDEFSPLTFSPDAVSHVLSHLYSVMGTVHKTHAVVMSVAADGVLLVLLRSAATHCSVELWSKLLNRLNAPRPPKSPSAASASTSTRRRTLRPSTTPAAKSLGASSSSLSRSQSDVQQSEGGITVSAGVSQGKVVFGVSTSTLAFHHVVHGHCVDDAVFLSELSSSHRLGLVCSQAFVDTYYKYREALAFDWAGGSADQHRESIFLYVDRFGGQDKCCYEALFEMEHEDAEPDARPIGDSNVEVLAKACALVQQARHQQAILNLEGLPTVFKAQYPIARYQLQRTRAVAQGFTTSTTSLHDAVFCTTVQKTHVPVREPRPPDEPAAQPASNRSSVTSLPKSLPRGAARPPAALRVSAVQPSTQMFLDVSRERMRNRQLALPSPAVVRPSI